MKNFPCSPRTSRQSTGASMSSNEWSHIMLRRTSSPSMPKGGHVLSIKSSWENRSKLPFDTGISNYSYSERYEENGRPSWNRSKTIKTINTRSSYSGARYEDQENRGDSLNRSGRNSNTARPMCQDKKEQRASTKNVKDNTWVKQTNTDDTTSLSSHSNEISIGKTLSNISDVSAPSQASYRYKSRTNRVESYTSRYDRSSSHKYSLVNKLDSDGLQKKHSDESSTLNYSLEKLSSSDESSKNAIEKMLSESETSRLNYSLERLSEGGEEETYSRPSLGSRHGDNVQMNKKAEHTASSSVDVDDSLQSYVDLSSRLTNKLSTVPSTDSSLVYSMGYADEPYDLKKFAYSYSYDGSEDHKANDLMASTLAECRLLLEMSPPPTPLAKSPLAKRDFGVKSPVARKEDVKTPAAKYNMNKSPGSKQESNTKPITGKEVDAVERPPTTPVNKDSPSVASSPANSSVTSTGLGNFLMCPCCRKEFTNDTSNNEKKERQPLHSFACDHIICYRCVFASPSVHMVACPKCNEENAFDKTKPVVSRSYCNLVKSIEILNSAKKDRTGSGGEKKQKKCERSEDVGSDGVVPQKIRFSQKNVALTNTDVALKIDAVETNNSDNQKDDTYEQHKTNNTRVSEMIANTPPYPEEPETPVSRAEFRFMQRKEKLAKSLEKVNRLLEKSRVTRNEFALNSIEEDLGEKKSSEEVSVNNQESKSKDMRSAQENKAKEMDCDEMIAVTASDDLQESLDEDVPAEGGNGNRKYFEKPTVDTLWTDEAICLSRPHEQSGQKRIKPELRVDTGNYTPIQRQRHTHLDLKDEPTISPRSVDVQSKNDTIGPSVNSNTIGSSVNEIFRGNPMSPKMNFGALENRISSEDSSMTDRDSDNRLLLGNSVPNKSGGHSVLKEKKYGVHKPSPLKDVKAMSAEKRRGDEHRCPQFLPSLTYSTIQESDELVGLMREKNGMSGRGGGSRRFNSHNVTPSKMFMRNSRSYKGVRLSFGKAESFDESSLVRNQPYEFTQHSCSFSPSSAVSLRGALVTHKPRLHKRLLSKLKFKGKNQRLYSRR